ncbi:MAG: amidohydrolase family protein, partial [Nocardioidaceae bacterium]
MTRTLVDGAYVVTMDADRTEHTTGHVLVEGEAIEVVAAGAAPSDVREGADRVVDGSGCLLTPGLVNTHHHLYQWATRGLAVDATLFDWLTGLYPVWAGIDERAVDVAARGALAGLARSGCTTSSDHHYVFPRAGGDVFAAEVEAARTVGIR